MPRSIWDSEYIAVDWGTTNRRACRLSASGVVMESFEDSLGVLSLISKDFEPAVAQIRKRLGELPMILGGMIGSNKGWRNVPYVPCPARPADIAAGILWVNDDTGIIPGVSQNVQPDVMRGEEVQAIGAVASGQATASGLICFPGTHAKWIMMADGTIDKFRTAMTGEIFGLLKTHSILADQLQGKVAVGPIFDAGVTDAIEHKPLLTSLFSIRARYLLGAAQNEQASYASGLLIGTDVVAAIERSPRVPIALVGQPELCDLYARSAELMGIQATKIDGASAFIKGIAEILRYLR